MSRRYFSNQATAADIAQAVADGKAVHWMNDGYTVINDKAGQHLIVWNEGGAGENCIGLTWSDGVTLNGQPNQFYVNA